MTFTNPKVTYSDPLGTLWWHGMMKHPAEVVVEGEGDGEDVGWSGS